ESARLLALHARLVEVVQDTAARAAVRAASGRSEEQRSATQHARAMAVAAFAAAAGTPADQPPQRAAAIAHARQQLAVAEASGSHLNRMDEVNHHAADEAIAAAAHEATVSGQPAAVAPDR